MTGIDFGIEAWLSDLGLYCRGNRYDPDKLRQVTAEKSDWTERLKRNIEHVFISRQLNAIGYEGNVDFEFASDDALYAYLFDDDLFPEWN